MINRFKVYKMPKYIGRKEPAIKMNQNFVSILRPIIFRFVSQEDWLYAKSSSIGKEFTYCIRKEFEGKNLTYFNTKTIPKKTIHVNIKIH